MSNGLQVLFIAFSVLITILVCSFALYLFREQKDVVNIGNVIIDEVSVAYHNVNYIPFDKDNLYYSDVKKLINIILNNNINKKNTIYQIEVIMESDILNDTYISEGYITDENIFEEYDYLVFDSLKRGDCFKAEMMPNQYGIISKIRISCIK